MKKYKNLAGRVGATVMVLALSLASTASANDGVMGSTFYTGTAKMINDVSTALTVLCPIAAAVFAAFFFIRRGMADEQDGKMWSRRIMVAVICGVGGTLTTALIAVVSGYYK